MPLRSFQSVGLTPTARSRAQYREPRADLPPPPLVLNQASVLEHVQGAGNWRPETG
jgi:hypothetical protein